VRCSATAGTSTTSDRPGGVVLTIHNLAYHGWTPRESCATRASPGRRRDRRRRGRVDLLWAGIERSDLVNTVSPGYARESLGPELGFGLDATLRAKGDRYLGS
jgi:starch synthase